MEHVSSEEMDDWSYFISGSDSSSEQPYVEYLKTQGRMIKSYFDSSVSSKDTDEFTLTVKLSPLINLKTNTYYWNNYAFKDIIIEGDIDRLNWMKSNNAVANNLCVYEMIIHPKDTVYYWFNLHYKWMTEPKSFNRLLEYEINNNFNNLKDTCLIWYNYHKTFVSLKPLLHNLITYFVKFERLDLFVWFENYTTNFRIVCTNFINQQPKKIIQSYFASKTKKYIKTMDPFYMDYFRLKIVLDKNDKFVDFK